MRIALRWRSVRLLLPRLSLLPGLLAVAGPAGAAVGLLISGRRAVLLVPGRRAVLLVAAAGILAAVGRIALLIAVRIGRLLGHASHSCSTVSGPSVDVGIDDRADAELPGVQGIGLLEGDGDIPEGLVALFVQILPDHVRERRADTRFVGTQYLAVGGPEADLEAVRGDRAVALVVNVVGHLALQGVGDLGRLHRAAEHAARRCCRPRPAVDVRSSG